MIGEVLLNISKKYIFLGSALAVCGGIAVYHVYKNWTLIRNSLGHEWNPSLANIQIAIDDLGENPGWVNLPAKKFLDITEPILWPNNCEIRGQGKGRTVLRLADGASSSGNRCNIIENVDQVNGNSNMKLSNLTLDGNGLNQEYEPISRHIQNKNHGIFLKYADNVVIDNIEIIHPSDCGIYWWFGKNNLVQNSHFAYCGEILEGTGTIDAQPSGIWADCQDGMIFKNLTCHDTYSGGFKMETQYQSWDIYEDYSKNGRIENCKSWNGYSGIWVERAHDIDIVDCECFDNQKTEAYETFGAAGFVTGGRSHSIHHYNCNSYRNGVRGFSSSSKYGQLYSNCKAGDNNLLVNEQRGGGFCLFRGDYEIIPHPVGYHQLLNCYSYDNNGYGIYYYSRNPTILFNTIQNIGGTGHGIYCGDDDPSTNEGGEIAFNTISNYSGECIRNMLANVNEHDNDC